MQLLECKIQPPPLPPLSAVTKKSGWKYSCTFLLDFWQFFANEKSYQSVKRNRFFGMVYFIFLNQFLCTISLIDYFNLACTNSIKSNSNCFSCGKLYAGLKKYNNAVGGIADKHELCGSGNKASLCTCNLISYRKEEYHPWENWLRMGEWGAQNYFPSGTFHFKLRLRENKRGCGCEAESGEMSHKTQPAQICSLESDYLSSPCSAVVESIKITQKNVNQRASLPLGRSIWWTFSTALYVPFEALGGRMIWIVNISGEMI